jgi:hypothetical protein
MGGGVLKQLRRAEDVQNSEAVKREEGKELVVRVQK